VAVLDESALTGEVRPVERPAREPVRSGVVNAGGPFDLRATATAADSTYAGIIRLVSEAEASPAPFVPLADRYAGWFLLVTLAAAGAAWAVAGPAGAVAVLVVATPCPLILAAPVALVSGLSVAARRGVVVKGGGVLERLAQCSILLLDKTGTLTAGRPSVSGIVAPGPVTPPKFCAWRHRWTRCRGIPWLVRWSPRPPAAAASWCCRSRWRRCPGRASAGWSTGAKWPSARPAG
jgi:P-type E1-E2 ATPase